MNQFELLEHALSICEKRGAEASAKLRHGNEWSTNISNGAIELHEAASSQGIGITCYLKDGRNASVSTNDLQLSTIERLANEAVDLAEAGAPDEWKALANADQCGQSDVADLDDGGNDFNEEQAVQLIMDAERIAKAADKRIVASHRSGVSMQRGQSWYATSKGVRQEKVGSSYSAQLVLVAEQNGEKQMGYSWTANRAFKQLRSAEDIAAEAVQKTIAGYGWKQAKTGVVDVVFSNEMASSLLGLVASLASGNAVYRGSSCWSKKLGEQVASDLVTVVDDPLIAGALGSRSADSDGIQSKALTIIKDGKLESFLTDVYSSRRLNMPLTAHGGGASNVLLSPGTQSEDDLLAQMGEGLYLTKVHGHGVELSSGHWSKGAEGFWISGGKRAYPVQNVTLAGNLLDMFPNIKGVANNPRPEASVSSPSLLISGMNLGGSDS